ncbi:MAG: AAA family ATPase, partial [Methanophagales archaeon]|nr:AAA family ATPase [Methanophagales archaeon]
MSGTDELEAYIQLMNLMLEHPFTTEIPIANGGRRNSSEEFIFAITPSRYRKLDQIRGDYKFKYSGGEYECNIVQLIRNQVRLRIEGLDARQKHIKSGAINVDMSNIIEREIWGLHQLREENFVGKMHLLFGNGEIAGGVQSECIFEEKKLIEEQKRAVEYAVGVRDVYLIWGPPGTGKTTIVPEIVRNYIRLHKDTNPKILVCSYTNRAVDNVVMKLFDRCKNIIVRFGSSTLTDRRYKDALFDELLKKNRKEIEKAIEKKFKLLLSPLKREKKEKENEVESKNREKGRVEEKKKRIKREIDALNAEINRIKKQITDKEHTLLKTNLEEEIVRSNGQLQQYRDNHIELPAKKEGINEGIKELEKHVSKLKDVKSEFDGQLAEWTEKEKNTANVILIIVYYLDFAEGPRQEIE